MYGFTETIQDEYAMQQNLKITIFKYHTVNAIQNEEQN